LGFLSAALTASLHDRDARPAHASYPVCARLAA